MDKPPLGIKPRFIFLESRITELVDAIYRQLQYNSMINFPVIQEWTTELNDRVNEYVKWKEGKLG
jgi:hypothetical protein